MKTICIFLMAAALSLASVPAHAQLGGLLNKAKSSVNKVKNDVNKVKKDIEDVSKRVNGDVDFTLGANHKGVYRARTRQIILDDLHQGGDRAGKKTYYPVEDNGDIVAEMLCKVLRLQREHTLYATCHIQSRCQIDYLISLFIHRIRVSGAKIQNKMQTPLLFDGKILILRKINLLPCQKSVSYCRFTM